MSYCTKVRIDYCLPDDTIKLEMLLAAATACLEEWNCYADDVLKDLIDGFNYGYTEFQDLRSVALSEIFLVLSRKHPTVTLRIWGHGEDSRDIWTREFLGGEVTFDRGPFYDS